MWNELRSDVRRGGLRAPGRGWATGHVLVAEDDDDIRAVLVAALRCDGYEVIEVRDGGELLEYLGTSMLSGVAWPLPQVIVSDVRMPGFSGLEVLNGLACADWRIPVVLITAYGDEETLSKAGRLGVFAVFQKPFEVDALRAAVTRATRHAPSGRTSRHATHG